MIHYCRGVSYCDCECHIEGFNLKHCMPCCNLCYMKYINPMTREVDMDKVNKYVDEFLKWKKSGPKSTPPTAKEENMKEFEKARSRKIKVIMNKPDPIETFQIHEKDLIGERRFGLIAKLCNTILDIQNKTGKKVVINIDYENTKDGIISFNVYEKSGEWAINKETFEIGVIK